MAKSKAPAKRKYRSMDLPSRYTVVVSDIPHDIGEHIRSEAIDTGTTDAVIVKMILSKHYKNQKKK
jgi:hypothetical protein